MFSANLGFVLDECPDVELVGLKVPWCPQPATFAPLPWGAGVSGKCCPSISFVVGVPPTGVYKCLGYIFNITSSLLQLFPPFNFMWGF